MLRQSTPLAKSHLNDDVKKELRKAHFKFGSDQVEY